MRIFAKFIIASVFLFSACFWESERKISDQNSKTYKVVGISDGDSITIFDNEKNKELKVRLATIDAPERNQDFGRKSRQHLSNLVYKKKVTLNKFSKDRYKRVVAEVYLDGKNINIEQIKNGFAWHYKKHQKQQRKSDRLAYSLAEDEARNKRLGIWQNDNPTPPWDFRKQKRRKTKKPKATKYL